MAGTYFCRGEQVVNLAVLNQDDKFKALVDSGLFANPKGFYAAVKVNGAELRGPIIATVDSLTTKSTTVSNSTTYGPDGSVISTGGAVTTTGAGGTSTPSGGSVSGGSTGNSGGTSSGGSATGNSTGSSGGTSSGGSASGGSTGSSGGTSSTTVIKGLTRYQASSDLNTHGDTSAKCIFDTNMYVQCTVPPCVDAGGPCTSPLHLTPASHPCISPLHLTPASHPCISPLCFNPPMLLHFNPSMRSTLSTQRSLFTLSITGVPDDPAPVFSNVSYYTSAGQLVVEFACAPTATSTPGAYFCSAKQVVNLSDMNTPGNRFKVLVDAGLFSNPKGFYAAINVNGTELRGEIITTISSLL
ncbi:unnamed protein product [Closterium sp. Yama58-4]|nr:unnamed protein product [Closterium sp. Yama58-4]